MVNSIGRSSFSIKLFGLGATFFALSNFVNQFRALSTTVSTGLHELHSIQPTNRIQNGVHYPADIDTAIDDSNSDNNNNNQMPAVSFCLLIKDDNTILNEWIAYHYHVMNMRRLIVAVDPTSSMSPKRILEDWSKVFHDLYITTWNDDDYMPQFFLDEQYDQVPLFFSDREVRKSSITGEIVSIFHRNGRGGNNFTKEQIVNDLEQINIHRFRQKTFVSQCFKHLKEDGMSWTVHIDTDEYIVPNPVWFGTKTTSSDETSADGDDSEPAEAAASDNAVDNAAAMENADNNAAIENAEEEEEESPIDISQISVPPKPTAGSLVALFGETMSILPDEFLKPCVLFPRLLFGSKEDHDDDDQDGGDNGGAYNQFESLRWKYHGKFDNPYNGLPKSIVNVGILPDDHPIFTNHMVNNIHQPLQKRYSSSTPQFKRFTCPAITREFDPVYLHPLSIQHYLGSFDRYMSRQNDSRRNPSVYESKSESASSHKDNIGWINTWLDDFIQQYGSEKVFQVLKPGII